MINFNKMNGKSETMKKTIFISVFVLIGLIVWFGWNEYSTQSLHKEISGNEVSEIKLWGSWGSEERIGNMEEKKKIIDWFNNITDIRENENFSGSTPSSGIEIELNSDERISILRSGKDFEVQRNGISYWGKQPNIRDLLNQLAKISIEEAKKLIVATQDFSQASSNFKYDLTEITPSDIWEKTKLQLFKDSSSETFIVTNQKAVHIGNGFGGFGVTSAVPYDVNKDGILDLVYAYSWGSGIHRSIISWIDLKSFTEHVVGDMPESTGFRTYDLILKMESKKIAVYRIASMDESKINMTLEKVGILIWENNELYNKQLP